MFRLLFTVCLTASSCVLAWGQDALPDSKGDRRDVKFSTASVVNDLPYRDGDASSACRLDLFIPGNQGFATVVWFHGGGLTGGGRELPGGLVHQGIAVVGVDYRLYPKVKVAGCIDDAAAAVAWTFANIAKYGGDPEKIFVSGHSAGGYLTSMVGLDKSYLAKYDLDADRLAGLAPLSGHTITHFTERKDRGLSQTDVVVDGMAPLAHLRADAPPMLVITGDRELEMLGRHEENAYFVRMMKVVKHPDITLYELDGFNHSGMRDPALPLIVQWVRKHTK